MSLRTPISPFHDVIVFVHGSLTEPQGVYSDANTAKVQTVGIPAGLNRGIIVGRVNFVTGTSHEK
jgi:hypothetical protein